MQSNSENKMRFSKQEREEIIQREKARAAGKSKTYGLTEARKLFRLKKT